MTEELSRRAEMRPAEVVHAPNGDVDRAAWCVRQCGIAGHQSVVVHLGRIPGSSSVQGEEQ